MNSPFFSIIIPVYNISEYIENTLNTIRCQTFDNFEVICIDDGSTDSSSELLDRYEESDNRFKVIHKTNGGVSSARNLALDMAKGDWIIFVDGDDALRYNALAIIAKEIENYSDLDIVGYGSKKVSEITQVDLEEIGGNYTTTYDDCSKEISFNAMNKYTVWSSAFRRSFVGKIRFLPMKNGEDQLFYNTLVVKVSNYLQINNSLYLYLQRPGSAINNAWTTQRQQDFMSMYELMNKNMLESGRQISSRWLKRWIGSLLINNNKVWSFPKKELQLCIDKQRNIISNTLQLKGIPIMSRLWALIACKISNPLLFRFVTNFPMEFYARMRK